MSDTGHVDRDAWLFPGDDAVPGASRSHAAEDRLLGEPRSLRRDEVSAAAGVSRLSARRFWRALGFANIGDEAEAFTTSDVVALRDVVQLVREGVLDEGTALGMTRAVGRSIDRLASWQVQLVGEYLADQRRKDGTALTGTSAAAATADLAAELTDRLEPLVVYAWRRHMAAVLARVVSDAAVEEDPSVTTVRSVGFADLVSFTRVVRRLSERELARMVQRFEAQTSDIVSSHGGRVVKTVGDEVLFVAGESRAAAGIALEISHTLANDDVLPDVRVGLATGPIVARMGDVFGTTVNRAARLTAIAQPGTAVTDDATARALVGRPEFEVERLARRSVRGLGVLTPWLLRGGT